MQLLSSATHRYRFLDCCFFLVVALCAASHPATAERLVASPKIAVDASASSVEIKLDGSYQHTFTLLADPPRAVIDLQGITIPKPKNIELTNHALFKAIRVGRHGGFTRVVVDLIDEPTSTPKVSSHGSVLRVSFDASQAPVVTHKAAPFSAPTPPRVLSVARVLPSASPTVVAAETATPTPSPVPSFTPSATPTATPSATHTVAATPTFTAQPTASHTPTPRPSATWTAISSPPVSPTMTQAPSLTPTPAPSPTPTEILGRVSPSEIPVAASEENAEPTSQIAIGRSEKQSPEIPLADTELKFSVSALVVNLPYAGRGVQDVAVRNRSDRPLFMRASALRVTNPGGSPEALIPTTELLVSPRRLSLEPGQQRTVRLVVAKRPNDSEESVYRVQLIPDVEPFENQDQAQQFKVATGLALLVTVGPKNPRTAIESHWRKNTLVIENKGNVNVLLERGQRCLKEQCSAIPSRRIYPGARWEILLKRVDRVEFLQRSGDEFERLLIGKE